MTDVVIRPLVEECKVRQQVGDAEVPWVVADAETEYRALRGNGALLDLSSVSLIEVTGADALDFLQTVVARDVQYLTPERAIAALLIDDDGRPIDILTCMMGDDAVLVRTSPGAGTAVMNVLQRHVPAGVEVRDRRGERSLVGIEGPYAWSVVGEILDPELASLPFESVIDSEWDGQPVLFSRTGYTGEYGYQIEADAETIKRLADALSASVPAIGHETLEVAMLEVRQPLVHRELEEGDTVISAGLNWLVDLSKEEFLGRDAIVAQFEAGASELPIGLVVAEREPALSRGDEIVVEGTPVGHVVHAAWSPGLGGQLAIARVQRALAASGLELAVRTAAGDLTGTTRSSPYIIPESWRVPIL